MSNLQILGIGGSNGSGKDLLSEMLEKEHGWLFISSSRDLIIPELERRGSPIERENMADLTREWRKTMGKGAVIDNAIEMFNNLGGSAKFNGLVISSIRHPWEAERIHELGGRVIWVDADPNIRYERIYNRGHGSKDKKSYKQFLVEEQAEMNHHSDDHTTLNMAGVKAIADIFLINDTNDIEVFKKQIKQKLGSYLV